MKLLLILGVAVSAVVGQHAGEAHLGTAEPLPDAPDTATPAPEDKTNWQNEDHGDRSDDARGNQWESSGDRHLRPTADPSKTQVHVKINGLMTKKTPECAEPFVVGAHDANSKIEDILCVMPNMADFAGECPLPTMEDPDNLGTCIAMAPWCPAPLIYDSDKKACIPMVPRIGKGNAILDNRYIGAVLVNDGFDHEHKAPRVHQAVEMDPNDQLMVKERHAEEQALWNWEKVRKHTGH